MTKTEKEIVEEFWKTWEAGADVSRYDVPNREFVEEAIIFGIKSIRTNENLKPFQEIVSDVESLPLKEWKKKHKYFYKWLVRNGFVYNKGFDYHQVKAEGIKAGREQVIEAIKRKGYYYEYTDDDEGNLITAFCIERSDWEKLKKEAEKC